MIQGPPNGMRKKLATGMATLPPADAHCFTGHPITRLHIIDTAREWVEDFDEDFRTAALDYIETTLAEWKRQRLQQIADEFGEEVPAVGCEADVWDVLRE